MSNRDDLRARLDAMVRKEQFTDIKDWHKSDTATKRVALKLLQCNDELEAENKDARFTIASLILACGGAVAVPDDITTSVDSRTLIVVENKLYSHETIYRAALAASSPLPGSTEVE